MSADERLSYMYIYKVVYIRKRCQYMICIKALTAGSQHTVLSRPSSPSSPPSSSSSSVLSRPRPRLDTIPAVLLPLVVLLAVVVVIVRVFAVEVDVGLVLVAVVDFKADLRVNLVFFLVSLCAAADWFRSAAYIKEEGAV